MALEIIMPKAGMAMEEGKIVRWLKEVGDKVESGEALMEIETDKITMENESPADGYLLAKLYGDGAVVPVTTAIGYIGKQGEDPPRAAQINVTAANEAAAVQQTASAARSSPAASAALAGEVLATPYAKKLAADNGIDIASVTPSAESGIVKARDLERSLKVTPLAAGIAADRGIDLSAVKGTGWAGKIMTKDLPRAAAPNRLPLSGIRAVIARNMLKSHLEIPPVTQNTKVFVDEMMALRDKANVGGTVKITITDLVVKACAKAVSEFAEMRTEIDVEKQELMVKDEVNIGIAVALDEGLIVPVVKRADALSLGEISKTIKDFACRARVGALSLDECAGATFTVSNLGAYGVYTFTPIINQPNAAVMGVNCINEELALVDGEVVAKKYLMLSLTYDHRILDGAKAAAFSLRVKKLLENPIELLV